jgi:DNA-binding Lrp family transcriptional regulator
MTTSKNSILNEKDIMILEKLIDNGRKTSASISSEIDLGKEIINYRIKKLVKENLIVKFAPKINKEILGYTEYVIFLKLKIEDNISKEKFIKEQIGNKYLIWNIKSKEGWDIIIRLYCENANEFKIKLKEILENFQNTIAKYYTIMSIDEIKENEKQMLIDNFFKNDLVKPDFKKIKEEKDFVEIDKKDKQILNLLENDGRESYSKIAKDLGISSDTIKYRIEKMKEKGLIENFNPIINFSKLGFFTYACIIKFNFLEEKEKELFENFLKEKVEVIKAIKSLNIEEYFLNLVFKNKIDKSNFEKEVKNLLEFQINKIEFFNLD